MSAARPTDAELESRLAADLAAARWFAGKAGGVGRVTLHDRAALPGTHAEIVLLDVAPAGGASQRYVAVTATASGGSSGNAAGFDAGGDLARWLAAAVSAAGTIAGRRGRFVVHAIPPVPPAGRLAPSDAVATLGGDASNSSFVVREPAGPLAVKLLRRCRPGIQPEVELGRFFALESPWAETPRLRGWLEYVARPEAGGPDADDDGTTVIATAHDFVPGCSTAWESLLQRLPAGDRGAAAVDPLLPVVAALGRTTARMHGALAARPDLAGFAPRPATVAARRAVAAGMAAHAVEVFARVEREAARRQGPLAARLRRLLAARARLVDRFDRLNAIAATAHDIRVHGDYHLGQVLVGAGPEGALVIDFEGEPGRPLDERRAPQSAAKDLAGMCRSFDYLLRQAAHAGGPPYDPANLARLEHGFLAAYRVAAAAAAFWPAAAEADGLLDAYRLDKAIYELAYELDNRPDWIDVPLAALLDAAGG
jgi:trehalose synthase-fused probable maltokinase